MSSRARPILILAILFFFHGSSADSATTVRIEQITRGPNHHFYGYIGHVQNIPWNKNQRYIVALRTTFQDHLPEPDEAADIILIDTQDNYRIRAVDQTRAWNFQQGTMLYWNPNSPDTQLLFNDRDPKTNKVFGVLFDVSRGTNGTRIREYRFADTPIGNSGVAQNGGDFLGLNYGRLARLRPVTGYPGAYDWTVGVSHPADDGIFNLTMHTTHIGGHPEWEFGHHMIGAMGDRQVLYDTNTHEITGTLGTPAIFPKPAADIALSPNGKWIVNGFSEKGSTTYAILNRETGAWMHTPAFNQYGYTKGPLRNDPAPCWNRDSNRILFPSLTADRNHTRQLFIAHIETLRKDGR